MIPIQTSRMTRYYGKLCAVDHLTLEVGNEIFGLLGPNGSGKTTTVLMLTTLLRPTSGEASICGYDVVADSARVRDQISYVPQDMAVDIKLTGRENVALFAKLYGIPHRNDTIDEVLAIMDLSSRADDLVRTYSGGMRRRLELAQALVHEPKVLFLDEPTIGLDVAARRKIWDHIRGLRRKGMTVFVTTHYMDEADHSCDRVAIIDRGRVVAVDSPAKLKGILGRDIISARVTGDIIHELPEGISFLGMEDEEMIFSTENGSEKVPLLFRSLEEHGITVHSVSLREPTLDDVFIHMVKGKEEAAGFDDHKFRTMLRRRS
jgi:ABC-2 type transport system ATP-binding protein